MFKLNPNPTFFGKIEIPVPGSSPQPIEIEFRHKTKDGLKAFFESAQDGRADDDLLAEIIVGWRGVDAEYGADALRDLLQNYPAAAMEILGGYTRALTQAKAKN